MSIDRSRNIIRVLVADDDSQVLECYLEAFGDAPADAGVDTLDRLAAELFDSLPDQAAEVPRFDIVACTQGEDAIREVSSAVDCGQPFDVVILDVRMPPGIDGVEAGSRIRQLDPDVEIVFVSGYPDLQLQDLQRRVPPPIRLHFFNKPLSFSRLAEDVATMVRSH